MGPYGGEVHQSALAVDTLDLGHELMAAMVFFEKRLEGNVLSARQTIGKKTR
jgi:hypothetical protein